MSYRVWSAGELQAVKAYMEQGKAPAEIAKHFPYRTPESVSRQIRRLKNQAHATEAEEQVLISALEQLRKESKPVPNYKTYNDGDYSKAPRELEICIMDPHFGMRCATPESDHPWSMDLAEQTCLWAIETLLERARTYADKFSRIIFPFGNDFLHADNIYHTTTKGTNQPEMDSWHDAYKRGIDLAIWMVDLMKDVAPVKIYQIPGNHSTHSDYTMGLILDAYYHNDANVEVDCSSSPYKFHRFGTNLIGYEHGNNVAANRYASLMANERPQDWAETSFREWHIGDQHRKATSKPSSFEEAGVSVEYLPGLTPPNKWHRTMAYNYQKRGAVAFVWHETLGQEAKFICSLDAYTGKPME